MGDLTPSRAIQLAAVGIVGVASTSVDLWSDGDPGRRAAVVLAMTGVIAAWGLATTRSNRLAQLAVLVAAAGFGALATVGTVGRAPTLVMVATLSAAYLSFGSTDEDGHWLPTRLLGVVLVGGASATWPVTESFAVAVAAVGIAAGASIGIGRSGALRRLDGRLVAAGSEAIHFGSDGAARAGRGLLPRLAAVWSGLGHLLGRLGRGALDVARTAGRWLIAKENRPILLAGIIGALIVAPLYPRLVTIPPILVRGTNDIPGTIERAEWIRFWPFRMPVPHPGWSLLLVAFLPIFGDAGAVTFILATATGAGVVVLITIARSRWDDRPVLRWPYAWALGLGWILFESPAVLAPTGDAWWQRFTMAGEKARGTSYSALHQWSTPTITLSMPFAFALFALVLHVMRSTERAVPDLARRRRWLVVLTVVSTLVQPATTLAVAPACILYAVVSGRMTKEMARSLARFVVPGAVICLGQVVFLASNVSPYEQATWIWDPFWVLPYFGADRASFYATWLFYPLCIWAGGRRYLRDPAVQLAFWSLVVSVPPFLLLEQTTVANIPDGDLGVMPLMSLIFLFLSSLRFVLIEMQGALSRRMPGERLPPWLVPTVGFLAIMAVAGVLDLFMASGVIAEF